MSKFEFYRREKIYELKHQLKTVVYFFPIVFGKDSVLVNQISILMNKVEMNETTFTANFYRDPSFGIKFFYQSDRCLQQFLWRYSYASDVEDIYFDLIDLSHIHLSVMIFFSAPYSNIFQETRYQMTTINMILTQNQKRDFMGLSKSNPQTKFRNWKITRPASNSLRTVLWNTAQYLPIPDIASECENKRILLQILQNQR